jgi:hypothetical protein
MDASLGRLAESLGHFAAGLQLRYTMKTTTVALGIFTLALLSHAFGYTYRVGYSRGSAEERLHWLVSHQEDGAWTARENPAHPIFKRRPLNVRPSIGASANSIPATYSP